MPMHIRPLEPRDYGRMVEIENTQSQQPGSVEEMAYFISTWLPERPVIHLVAELDGEIVGGASVMYKAPWVPAGVAVGGIIVDPLYRGRGVGRALWAALQPFLQEHRPQRLRTGVRDDYADSLAWADRRGFARQHHIFDSTMDPTQFDETPFRGVVEQAEARGLRWVHFDEIQTPETEHQLWAYFTELLLDVPDAADRQPSPYEDWRKWFLESPSAWPAGTILAVTAAGEWAGMTAMTMSPQNGSAGIAFTTVSRPFRGAGLALAIKVYAIRWLAAQGVTSVLTNNHSANERMLAVNRKLGYIPTPGFYSMIAPYGG